ncbi:MAG TPA: hypothetical protein VGM59_01935, partial [Dongiaceae bacterium]
MSDTVSPVGRVLPNIATPTLQTGTIADPPRNLAALAPGTIVKGTVMGRGNDGLVSVALDQGTVKVATNAQLPPGSSVILEVRNAGDRLQVLILAVESNNARQAQTSTPQASTQTSQPAGSTTPASANSSGAAVSGSGGTVSSGTSGIGTAGSAASGGAASASGTAGNAAINPAPPVEVPTIEVVGSSIKGVVVQAPPPASLLNIPAPDPVLFTASPSGPIAVPSDVVLKAQLLAQTLQIVAPEALPISAGIPEALPLPGGATAGVPPFPPAPLPSTPPVSTPLQSVPVDPLLDIVTSLPAGTSPSAAGIALQPEVAAKILALFSGDAPQPNPVPGTAATALTGSVPNAAIPTGLPSPLQAGGLASAVLPAGTELTLHVIAVLPGPGQALEIAPEAARLALATAPLVGRVLGYTKAGFPVVDTPAGAVMLQQKARLPVGTQVALAFEIDQPRRADALPMPTTPQQAILYYSRGWPTLEDLFAALSAGPAQSDPDSPADNPLTRLLPQAGPKLAAGLLNAAAALRSGDIEQFLGAYLASRKLPAGKEDVVRRMRQEFSQISELAKDRPDVDWRALFLPVYDERIGLTQINLYYRQGHGNDKDEPEQKNSGTRFIVEVNFALLGAFQLDGLVRRKRFDLMIRSRKRLTQAQRREIHGIFEEAVTLGGYAG